MIGIWSRHVPAPRDKRTVIKNLVVSARAMKLEVKDVLQAAVNKGYMTQAQLNTVLDVAAKNADLAKNEALVSKIKNNKLSNADVKALSVALQGQVTGAAYYCGYYGCYNGGEAAVILGILILAVLFTPVYFVVY